jgi:hypothetical protein
MLGGMTDTSAPEPSEPLRWSPFKAWAESRRHPSQQQPPEDPEQQPETDHQPGRYDSDPDQGQRSRIAAAPDMNSWVRQRYFGGRPRR